MRINRDQLLEALEVVKPGLASKELIEQTTSFAFLDGMVVTYNDEISISHPVEGIEFEGAIKAKELYGLLNRIDKKVVSLSISDEGTELLFNAGRIRSGLRLETDIKLPIDEFNVEGAEWKEIKNPSQLRNSIALCAETCATDMSRLKLTCVDIKNNGVIQGSDGFRFLQCLGEALPFTDDEFLLPAHNAVEVSKFEFSSIMVDKGWVHFKNEDVGSIFSCRFIEEEYVDQNIIENVVQFEDPILLPFPKKMIKMIDLVGQFAERKYIMDEKVDVIIEDGHIMLKAETEDTKSWVKNVAAIDTEEKLSFSLTPSLFKNILLLSGHCSINPKRTKIKFSMEIGGDYSWCYVIMLRDPKTD